MMSLLALLSTRSDTATGPVADEQALAQTAPIEALRLLACLSPYPSASPLRAVCLQLIDRLRSIATFETAALFVVSDNVGEAEALFVVGSGAPYLRACRDSNRRTADWLGRSSSDLGLELGCGTRPRKLCFSHETGNRILHATCGRWSRRLVH